MAGDFPAVFGALVGAEEELLHPGGWVFGEVEVGETFADGFDTEFGGGEVEHDFGEAGDGGGVSTSAEGDDEAIRPGFAHVIEVGEGHGAGEFFLF